MGNNASREAERQERAKQEKIARLLPAYGEDMVTDMTNVRGQFEQMMGSIVNQAAAGGQVGMTLQRDPGEKKVGLTAVAREQHAIFNEKAGKAVLPEGSTVNGAVLPEGSTVNGVVNAAFLEVKNERNYDSELAASAASVAENLSNTKSVGSFAAINAGMRGSSQNAMMAARTKLNNDLQTAMGEMFTELDVMVTSYEDAGNQARLYRAERADQALKQVASIVGQAVSLASGFIPTG